jgi:hypothetical protein
MALEKLHRRVEASHLVFHFAKEVRDPAQHTRVLIDDIDVAFTHATDDFPDLQACPEFRGRAVGEKIGTDAPDGYFSVGSPSQAIR